jgi:hypothetical protein
VRTKKNGVELYGNIKSFITVTGRPFHSELTSIKESQGLIDKIIKVYLLDDREE